uniref:Protein deacetylase HDAC6 n=1 Tax=Neogobius melanostomus TaxID=47308 RepID=A0A8C6WN44_9GOBI
MSSDPPDSGLKSVRRSPRFSPQGTGSCPDGDTTKRSEERKGGGRLQEAKRRGKMEREHREDELNQKLQQLDLSSRSAAVGTGLVYSEEFAKHRNLWDTSHPECPERLERIMEELEKQELLSRCIRVQPREATDNELLLIHSQKYVDLMRSTQTMTERDLKSLSENYDSVYLHPDSFSVAALAVGSVLQLIDRVLTSEIRNGFALVRPPGHHAQRDQSNGYCVFNNVAIAARYAQTRHKINRVLIVDWDVHHGQGIQYSFQNDPSVLYFSVHRFEQGLFWPHLSESNSDFIGDTRGAGGTINLPWNKTGMTDADYIAAFYHLLLPVAYEFQPQLVLVSAGFDAAVGDPKGEMCVSPQCFQTLTHLLMSLAEGRVILALEGGYDLVQTAEGAAACVRALLGGACPPLTPPTAPSDSALESISQTISSLYPHWPSLQVLEGCSGSSSKVLRESANRGSTQSRAPCASTKTGLVYDKKMMEHINMWDRHHPEQPQRIAKIYSQHQQLGLEQRCERLELRLATEEELLMCHSADHIARMKSTADLKPRDLFKLGEEFTSIFLSNQSYECALMAAGGCFRAVEAVLTGQVSNSVAIVRPPGHHAEKDFPCGFCLFNTAALAARYAQKLSHNPSLRVLILDWDVHHGNGTQHLFEDDDSVLYVSLHRYDNGSFFPFSEDAACDRVGVGKGAGFNVNVAWSGRKMGDAEYIAAFHRVVMPIATEFNPDLVLVSAGFDAARGDPLGGYNVSPEGYAHLTHLLLTLASGKLIMILEGGYNLTSISESMALCTSVLLGDPPPSVLCPPPHHNAVATINEVIRHHAPFWSSLWIHIPDSVRESVPSPKHRGKRSSKGKGRKSDQSNMPPHPAQDLDQLTLGLAGLEITQTTAVGGARPKLRPSSGKSDNEEKKSSETQVIANTETKIAVSKLEPSPEKGAESGVSPVKGAESEVSPVKGAESVVSPVKGAESGVSPVEGPKSGVSPVEGPKSGVSPVEGPESGAVCAEPETEGACGWTKTNLQVSCGVEMGGASLFVVNPLPWCPHLDLVKPLPPTGLDVFKPCEDCGSQAENWVCLTCYKVCCGRYVNEHMVIHGVTAEHPVVLSYADLSVWCYLCESYVHNQVLFEPKNAAHWAKFGEAVPPWTEHQN